MPSLSGDVTVKVDGAAYVMRFGGAALMALEDAFDGQPWNKVLNDFAEAAKENRPIPMKDVAAIVLCALQRNHPDLTLEDAADLAMLAEIQEGLSAALSAAFPQAKGAGDDTAPRPRRNGTGTKR